MVFLIKDVNKRLLNSALGLSAGIMISATFFSLLIPSIEMSEKAGFPKWFPPVIGFGIGGITLYFLDKLIPHLHLNLPDSEVEGIPSNLKRAYLLVFAVTLHNIPEGLAIGVAFGVLIEDFSESALIGAISLALGIAIQNFPEGSAISFPLRAEGYSKTRSFFWGLFSGLIEPLFAIIGFYLITFFEKLLPFSLSFAAGAMIYVVVEELIPASQSDKNSDVATISTLVGFTIMMFLDVSLS